METASLGRRTGSWPMGGDPGRDPEGGQADRGGHRRGRTGRQHRLHQVGRRTRRPRHRQLLRFGRCTAGARRHLRRRHRGHGHERTGPSTWPALSDSRMPAGNWENVGSAADLNESDSSRAPGKAWERYPKTRWPRWDSAWRPATSRSSSMRWRSKALTWPAPDRVRPARLELARGRADPAG